MSVSVIPPGADVVTLLGVWQGRTVEQWAGDPQLYRALGSRLLGAGEPLLAYDVTSEGLEHAPGDVRLRQLQGLALARSGATERATQVLHELYTEGHADEETVGMLARTNKDLALRAGEPLARASHLRQALDLYVDAYQRHAGAWSGINAATMATLLGERERGLAIARAVQADCLRQLHSLADGADDYWLVATLGEASIILQEWTQAEEWYARAAAAGRHRLGDLASTRRNARLLLAAGEGGHDAVLRALRVPGVALFAGPVIDGWHRLQPHAPLAIEDEVATAIRARLAEHDCRIGYASAAPGADIVFLETLLDLGGEATIVLPYDAEEFVRDGVALTGDAAWAERSQRVLRRATRVIVASHQRTVAGEATFEFANLLLHGLAANQAEHLDTQLVPVAVWDGEPGGPGGTASTVARWRRLGLPVEIVSVPKLPVGEEPPRSEVPPAPAGFSSEIVALLFADAVHFSRLGEEEVVRFAQHFLGAIGELIASSPHRPTMKNTWGDGLFFVFASVRDAGLFALALRDLVNATIWAEKGLPSTLNLRIGLHAGPVFGFTDPVTGRANYLGTQVSRAARIEPVTPPGHVYASEAFAALAAADRIADFTCDYVGQTPLAKGYGTFPTYHVRPAVV